jgi:triacylglycerol esterase/lipase EstA (alpha/beta hydrolase family)
VEQWGEEEGMEATLCKKKNNNNSIENLVGNEENGYQVPDPNKTMINVTNEPRNAHKKKSLKEEIMEEITVKLMEKTLDTVNQKLQDVLKRFQHTKNKEYEKIQK